MKKSFLIVMLLAIISAQAFSQATDSLKIDSLKKQLLHLKDSAKIDCLNLLARRFSTNGGQAWTSWSQVADSVDHYASIAYDDANKIGYKRGVAAALTNRATSEWSRGIDLRKNNQDDGETVKRMEEYLSEAIPMADQLKDYEILGYAYEQMCGLVYIKSKRKDHNSEATFFKKAIDCFHIVGNEHKEGENCLYLAERYVRRGYYEEGLEYLQRALELNKKSLSKKQTKEEKEYGDYLYQQSLADMADLYKTAGDFETALVYINQSCRFALTNNTGWNMEIEKAEIFQLLAQHDSAFFYLNKLRKTAQNADFIATIKLALGSTFLAANQTDSALAYLKPALDYFKKKYYSGLNFGNEILVTSLLYMGSAYGNKGQYHDALSFTREGITMATNLGIRPRMMQGYELLSKIYHNLGNNDSAYQYLNQYVTLKDSIQNRQFLFRLNSYKKAAEDAKKESRIGFLIRNNQIKQQQLKQQATFRNFIIAAFIALLSAGLYVFRNINLKRKNEELKQEQKEQEWKVKDLENENKHIELQKQSADLEMQALRAQMNPHFIFNSLSSINHFILKNESKTASSYLTRFSRLIRMVLINSQRSLITLEDELQMLELYLEMERLRFKNSFDYSITFLNTIDSDNILVPPLLLQPFCENAIWHGLMHKEGQGRLHVGLSMENNVLNCTITDNGIGREKAEQMKSKSAEKEKSMGLRITEDRLNLLNREKGIRTIFKIEDLRDLDGNSTGTRVHLKISYQKAMEVANT
jgi:tetratricopeptide (TPR) repeat protein